MSAPSAELAERITRRLVAEKLVAPADAARITTKLADGTCRAEDWRLAVEKMVEEATKG